MSGFRVSQICRPKVLSLIIRRPSGYDRNERSPIHNGLVALFLPGARDRRRTDLGTSCFQCSFPRREPFCNPVRPQEEGLSAGEADGAGQAFSTEEEGAEEARSSTESLFLETNPRDDDRDESSRRSKRGREEERGETFCFYSADGLVSRRSRFYSAEEGLESLVSTTTTRSTTRADSGSPVFSEGVVAQASAGAPGAPGAPGAKGSTKKRRERRDKARDQSDFLTQVSTCGENVREAPVSTPRRRARSARRPHRSEECSISAKSSTNTAQVRDCAEYATGAGLNIFPGHANAHLLGAAPRDFLARMCYAGMVADQAAIDFTLSTRRRKPREDVAECLNGEWDMWYDHTFNFN